MRASDLPSPGVLSNSQNLRHTAAHAISRAEINAGLGTLGTAAQLSAFFAACKAAVDELLPADPEE